MSTIRFSVPRRVLAVALLATVVVGGCGRDDKDNTDAINASKPIDQTLEMPFDLQVSGDDSVSLTGTRKVRVLTRRATDAESLPYSVASVTLPEPPSLPDGRFVNPEIGMAGLYDKDGTFTLPAGLGTPPRTGSTVAPAPEGSVKISVVQVVLLTKSPPLEVRYLYLAEPCKVTLEKKALKGRASCPSLVSYDGKKVSMTMAWGS